MKSAPAVWSATLGTAPVIEKQTAKLFDPPANPRSNVPLPVLTDFRVRYGKIYVMSRGILHQIDEVSGKLEHQTAFFIDTGKKRWHHLFHCFEVISPQKVLLGHLFGDPEWFWIGEIKP